MKNKLIIVSKIIKFIAPAAIVLFLHGLLPLYAVFLSYAAFYPAFDVLIDLILGEKKSVKKLKALEVAYLTLAAVVVLSLLL